MHYPIVQVKTPDELWLYGLLLEAPNTDTIFINIHGTASNFYEEYFLEVLSEHLIEKRISFLSTNNRGAGVYDTYQKSGAAVEKFEACLIDIDTWIDFALSKGYKNIILTGHSLGSEKIVYYMGHGKYAKHITALILFAPADSVGYQIYGENYEPSLSEQNRVDGQIKEAQHLVSTGKGDTFLDRTAYAGIMPKSAESILDFYTGPEMRKALPFHTRKLEDFGKIKVPMLAVIGDKYEYTAIPIQEALDLMKKENPNTETVQLKDCNHDFEGKEEELAAIVMRFLVDNAGVR